MTLTKHPATLTASVTAGLFLAMTVPHAAADPAPPAGSDSTDNSDAGGSSDAVESAPEAEIQKLNAAQVLENSASALSSFPSVFPETPVAMLETTAIVLSAVGLTG